MYFKLLTKIAPLEDGKAIAPELDEKDFNHDYENVYEWIDFRVPDLGLGFNISREHGFAELTAEEEEELEEYPEREDQILNPGYTYISVGLPASDVSADEVAQKIANSLKSELRIYEAEPNVDEPDSQTFRTIEPQ